MGTCVLAYAHICVPADLRSTSELSLQYSPLYLLRPGLLIGPELKDIASQSSQHNRGPCHFLVSVSLTCGMLHPPGIYVVLGILVPTLVGWVL